MTQSQLYLIKIAQNSWSAPQGSPATIPSRGPLLSDVPQLGDIALTQTRTSTDDDTFNQPSNYWQLIFSDLA